MYAFVTGCLVALLLAGGAYVLYQNTAISAIERTDSASTLIGGEGTDLDANETLDTN